MADNQASSNDINDGGDAPEAYDDDPTTTMGFVTEDIKSTETDDYVDEPIEDYVVKLVVDGQDEGVSVPSHIADAAITDIQGNIISSKTTMIDTFNEYSTTIYDELSTSTATGTGGKRLWGWSTQKTLIVGLIALCILAIIIAIVFLVLGKKFKKNKRSTQGGASTTAKGGVTKGSSDPKYQPVLNA